MTKISREEILKIAHGSQLELLEQEVEPLIRQIQDVLSYAKRVAIIAADTQEPSIKNINIVRPDVTTPCNAESILKRAPEREGDFFVVPVILEHN